MPLRVNGYDIDVMGIVHNLVYVRWFEDLRTRFLDLYWPLDGMLRDQQCPTILTTHAEYKVPLTIFDKPVGRLWLSEVGTVRWKISAEITTEQAIHCLGWQEGIFLDLKKRKPVRLPQPLLDKYQADLARLSG